MLDVWTDDLLTGNSLVDHQHQNLFKMIATLHKCIAEEAPRDQLAQSLESLGRYVISHFAAEELLMQDSNYPDFIQHKNLHSDLEHKINFYLDQFHKRKEIDLVSLIEFTSQWLKIHVLTEDMKIVKWIRNHHKADF